MFAVVGRRQDLVRASAEISAFFSFRRQRAAGWAPDPMSGIWLDPTMVREPPASLRVRHPSLNGNPTRIKECVGVSGIWVLCWLDDEGVSRLALLEALLETSSPAGGGASSGGFIPVFGRGVSTTAVQAEVRSLRDRYRQHVLAPWYQDPVTAELTPPAGLGEASG